jgi:hypothetical protein
MQRLLQDGYVAATDSYYYIPGNELDRIRRVLTDAHTQKHLTEDPDAEVAWTETAGDTEAKAGELVDEVAAEMETDDRVKSNE